MERLHVCLSPDEIERCRPVDFERVVIVDVLRASTTIVAAFANGATEIWPCISVEEALAHRGSSGKPLRIGERKAETVRGCDLGNSPASITRDLVDGRDIVMTTSNGTAALAAASRFAKRQIGGLVNATAVANDIGSFGQNTLVLCAGTDGAFSLDDAFGAGAIASSIVGATPDVDQTDAAMAARLMFEAVAENLPMALRATRHGQRLEQMGHSNDVDFAANLDAFAVVPDFVDGRLVDTMTSTRIR